jgi:hypothetical protein
VFQQIALSYSKVCLCLNIRCYQINWLKKCLGDWVRWLKPYNPSYLGGGD